MADLTFSITQNITDIPQKDWARLFSTNIIEGYGYHKIIQDAKLNEFSIFYLVAKENGRTQAIVPFFTEKFSFTTIIQGPLQKLILSIQKLFKNFLKHRILFIGLPTAEELYLGVDPQYKQETILNEILSELLKFSKSQKIKIILFYNLTQKHRALAEYLKKKGFAVMENFPNTVIELQATSLEGHIESLSKNTRKDLKRKLKRLNYLENFRAEVTVNIRDLKDKIHGLYLNNFVNSNVQFENLSSQFFEDICKEMPQVAKYFLTWQGNKLVAFNLLLIKGDTCIDKFIGFDKESAHENHLYYLTFCHNIDWCIKNNIRFYQMGITDYHPKLRLGAKLVPLHNYIKLTNPLLNIFLKPIAKLIEPKNFDPTLKKLRDGSQLSTKLSPKGDTSPIG